MLLFNIIVLFGMYCLILLCNSVLATANDSVIRTELVDGNNRKQILAMFNLTEAQMSQIYAGLSAANKEAEANGSVYFKNIRDFRINDIKTRISNAIQTKNSEEIIEYPLHEMAAYPTCNSETTESSWMHDNNITIQFSSSLFEKKMQNLNLDSATLRLFKINPNESLAYEQGSTASTFTVGSNANTDADSDDDDDISKPKRCADIALDAQIRVTVSIVQQMRRNKRGVYERKKRICNTIMMNVSSTGWVEIDIRRAIYIWENVGKQMEQQAQQTRPPVLVGYLMIEVHDEEEQPLKPGLFFKPPSCNQADLAIPWNYYRPNTAMSPFAAHEVPRYPRLDVKLVGYASFAPINHPNAQPDTVYASLKDKLFNLSHKSDSSETDNESTTQITSAAYNHLQEVDEDEQQHLHHKRHLKVQQPSEPLEDDEEDHDAEMDDQNEEEMPAEAIGYNYRTHPRRHHRSQHHHMRHQDEGDNNEQGDNSEDITNGHHTNVHHKHHRFSTESPLDIVELNLEREQHETKILEHIVHKLQKEQKQLMIMHQKQQQQQQQQQQTQAYDI
uniref:TGF-beta propeptide domain-containing protein n=1 Tax=Stomoxys calcitrans TaxID=35570 RepID=A0A1I8PUI3_STOCA